MSNQRYTPEFKDEAARLHVLLADRSSPPGIGTNDS